MYRPNFIVAAPINFNSLIYYDFTVAVPQSPDAPPTQLGAVWNNALWSVDKWYGGTVPQRNWVQASGIGVAASPAIGARTNGDTLWVSTDYSYIVGGLL
jgi:hypothetical protein